MTRNLFIVILLAILAGAIGSPASGDDLVEDVLANDEIEGSLEPGDVHRFRLTLVAGTEVRLDLEAEPEEGAAEASPELVLIDPEGGEIAPSGSDPHRIRVTTAVSGVHVTEVRAGSFEGEYQLEIRVEPPDSVENRVEVSGAPVSVHLDAPLGSSVRITVKRISGAPPVVTAVRDGTGRELGYDVRRAKKNRVRLRPVPVTAPGGLLVEVGGRDGGSGTYEVRGRIAEDDDEIPEGEGEGEEVESRRIVLFLEPGADPAGVAAALGYELEDVHDGFIVLKTPEGREGREREDARDAEDRFAEVLGAEPDVLAQTPEGSQSNGIALGSEFGRSAFDRQPVLGIVRADKAHVRATGQGVTVAVLDTGIDSTHSLLAGRVLPGFDFVDGDADPAEERNFLDDDGDGQVDEGFGHGTFVAGLVLAAAPDARILPVRVLDTDARGSASTVAAGITYAVAQGADVINLSLGMRGYSAVLRGAVRFATSRGVTVVAASGNGAKTTTIDFPGGVADVVAVSALDGTGARAPFANASTRTALAAPGVDVIGPYPDESWGKWSGTSFSAALASGGAALLLERHPALPPARVKRAMKRSSRGIRGVPRSERRLLGGGRLDLRRLAR